MGNRVRPSLKMEYEQDEAGIKIRKITFKVPKEKALAAKGKVGAPRVRHSGAQTEAKAKVRFRNARVQTSLVIESRKSGRDVGVQTDRCAAPPASLCIELGVVCLEANPSQFANRLPRHQLETPLTLPAFPPPDGQRELLRQLDQAMTEVGAQLAADEFSSPSRSGMSRSSGRLGCGGCSGEQPVGYQASPPYYVH